MDDPQNIIQVIENIKYIEVFDLLLRWVIPIFIILFCRDIILSIIAYIMIRSDKYVAMGKWVTVRGFTGRIVKLGPFSVVIENENGDGYKIPIREFKHFILHPIMNDPTKCVPPEELSKRTKNNKQKNNKRK